MMVMFNKKSNDSGFTIVELLIVIVVIAILAAITIVAYNGISTRAENTKTISAVSSMLKILKSYAANNGQYPPSGYNCIGTMARCSNMTGTTYCFGMGSVGQNGTIAPQLKTVVNALPEASTQQIQCSNGTSYSGAFIYIDPTQKISRVFWFLNGSGTDCGIAGSAKVVDGNIASCSIALETL